MKKFRFFVPLVLLMSLYGCGGGTTDPGADSGDNGTGGTTNPPPSSSDDTDGDGLTDSVEVNGWNIVIDAGGYGTLADAALLETRLVTSDPNVADSDNDGLTDGEEYVNNSDPNSVDTDRDGLTDYEETTRWGTNASSADSDGDGRDPSGTRPPDASFFDGAEVTAGTAPSQADTDGDGLSDYDEFEQSRDPVIAEIPRANIQVSGDIAIKLNVTYSETSGSSTEYGSTFTTSTTTSQSRSDTESTAITQAASKGGEGFFDDLEFSKGGAIKFFGGKLLELGRSTACEWGETGNVNALGLVQFDPENLPVDIPVLTDHIESRATIARNIFNPVADSFGLCDEPTPETTNTTSTTLTSSSSKTATEEYSRYQTDYQEKTETSSSGTVSLAIRVTNSSDQTFTLSNPELTMMQWQNNPSAGSEAGSGAFQTLATLTASGTTSFVVAPGGSATVQLQNDNVNPDFIKAFLARPQAIFFSPANFTYTDVNGDDFRYITEQNFNRTANIVIDDGQNSVSRFQVATNVDRTLDGEFAGLAVGKLFSDILNDEGFTHTVAVVDRQDENNNTVSVVELESINGMGTVIPNTLPDPFTANGVVGDPQRRWMVYMREATTSNSLTTDFDDLIMNPGEELRLVYIKDDDGDGLFKREEDLYGTSDDPNDSFATDYDSDGLTDAYEVKTGWDISIDYLDENGSSQVFEYHVTSSPVSDDADEDGLNDSEEQTAGTDPFNRDTDGDGVADGCEINPLSPDETTTNGSALASCNYAFAYMVKSNGGVELYQIDAGDGSLTAVADPVLTLPGNSINSIKKSISIDPQGRFAYAATGSSGGVNGFTLNKGTGQLTAFADAYQFDSNFSGLEDWNYVAVDPTGSFVYATDAGPDKDGTNAFVIRDGSVPGTADGQLDKVGFDNSGVLSNPDKVVFHPDGDVVYVIGNASKIGIASVDTDSSSVDYGDFSEISGSPVDTTDFVNDIAMTPDGKYLYASTRRSGSPNYLRLYAIQQSTSGSTVKGQLTALGSILLPGEVESLVIDPDGKFLYGSDSVNDWILPWSIDSVSGSLTAIDRLPGTDEHDGYATASNPDQLAIHPSGRALYVGATDGTLVQSIDSGTGEVTEFNPAVDVPVGNGNPDQIVIYRVK